MYRQRLLVDGREAVAGAVDDNGGKCVRYSVGGGFAHRVPCKLSASGSVSLDTSPLGDGPHELQLEVYDATATNKAAVGPWPIVVDNVPPTVGDVAVTGTAREGQALRCAATVEGQSPQTTYQWSRANPDGSGGAEIGGATAATYVLTAAEVGKKVLCRLTGTDGGGSATRISTLTTGPFADGATVAPAPPAAAPSGGGGATDAGTGTPGQTGAPGAAGAGGDGGATGGNGSTGAAAPAGATTTTTTATGSAAGGGALAAAAAAALATPACSTSTAKLFGSGTALTRSYARSTISLSGRVVGAGGQPRPGQRLDVVQTVARTGTAQRTKIGSLTTGPDGRFRLVAPRGPSRALQLIDPSCGAVGPIVTQRVRGAVQARTTTRRIRNRQTARITGRVLGGYIGRGVPLELQVKVGRQWRDVKHTMSNSRGGFRVSYRFLRTYVRYTYQFRIVTRAGGAWPYMPAKSRVVKVRVN